MKKEFRKNVKAIVRKTPATATTVSCWELIFMICQPKKKNGYSRKLLNSPESFFLTLLECSEIRIPEVGTVADTIPC